MGRDLSDQSLVFQFCPREQFDNLKQLKIGKKHTHILQRISLQKFGQYNVEDDSVFMGPNHLLILLH